MKSALICIVLATTWLACAGPAAAITDCQPNCQDQDMANRYTSVDPTDPIKRSNQGFKTPARAVVGEALDKAQKAIDAKQFDEALVQAKLALGASQTDYERLKSNQFLTLIYVELKDQAGAVASAEAAADMPNLPTSEKADVLTNACILATNAGHAAKAAQYARQMQALKLDDPRSQRIIATALKNEPKP